MLKEIWLIHPQAEACSAFRKRFSALPSVRVLNSTYENLPAHDAFVTAGNSFGIMSAGIDAAVVRRFGPSVMEQVQLRILDEYLGEQSVGTAFIVETGDDQRPYVIHAPTMRVPGNIVGTDHIYLATWAALIAVARHNVTCDRKIETVAFPAMGTGFGGVQFDEAARQMAAAYEHYLSPPHRLDWDAVIDRHKRIAYDGERQVVR